MWRREHSHQILLPSPTAALFLLPLHPLFTVLYLPVLSLPHPSFHMNNLYLTFPRNPPSFTTVGRNKMSLVLPLPSITCLKVPAFLVKLDLSIIVQMVGGWTGRRKSPNTQGTSFLLPLASAFYCQDSLHPDINVHFEQSKRAPRPLILTVVFDCPGSHHFHRADEQMVP